MGKKFSRRKNYDETELEQMVRVVLLFKKFSLGHRPKMSKIRVLTENGLLRDGKLLNRSDSVSECGSMINEFMSSSYRYSDFIHDFTLLYLCKQWSYCIISII